jgi:hypothetical protein
LCTTAFPLGQAAAAYGFFYIFFYIFAYTGDTYRVLFALGAAALASALATENQQRTVRLPAISKAGR